MKLQTILYPTDFSEPAQRALAFAADLARRYEARLLVLHAVESLGPENVTYGEATTQRQPDSYRQRLWNDLHQVRPADPQVPVEYLLSEDDPAAAILRTAHERGCDLIVLGSHGRSGWRRLLGGSVAEKVVRQAPCPVLVVKATAPADEPAATGTALHPHSLREGGTAGPPKRS
jgi:nucleotide-binding universal stress UspA family protein